MNTTQDDLSGMGYNVYSFVQAAWATIGHALQVGMKVCHTSYILNKPYKRSAHVCVSEIWVHALMMASLGH